MLAANLLAVNMLAVNLVLWPPNLGDGLQLLAMASNLTLPLLALFPKVCSLRLACGTAVKSVRISISVSLLVRVRDEAVECLPWTRRTGVSLYLPCLEMYVPRAGDGGLGREKSDFCLIFGIPSWLMPLRDRSDRSLFKVHWNLWRTSS